MGRNGAGRLIAAAAALGLAACQSPAGSLQPDFSVGPTEGHARFDRAAEPILRAPAGSIIEVYTDEATGGQFTERSTLDDFAAVDMSRVHAMTGPIYVEGAAPGDRLAVTLLELEPGDWGWAAVAPGINFLGEENAATGFKTIPIDKAKGVARFAEGVEVPLAPFPGILGVAMDTEEALVTFPPRANGGNMDNPFLQEGVTVYLPVFVEGAMFSIGDAHAAQGFGEVSGAALEAPMRTVLRLDVVKGEPRLQEPQYESDAFYATSAYAEDLDEAAKKAMRYMIAHIVAAHGLSEADAFMLCSLACDLHIPQVVNAPHRSVVMHISKDVFTGTK
ncbi:MAG: acetamidase/formamidase family protein [Pseudomonadota bacterium]